MREINRVFQLVGRTVAIALLAGLISLISLPTVSAYAFPFDNHSNQAENLQKAGVRPYDEHSNANIISSDRSSVNNLDESARNIPKNLGNNQKDVGTRVNRAANELGNDQLQRAFGADNYKRSAAEQQVNRNSDR